MKTFDPLLAAFLSCFALMLPAEKTDAEAPPKSDPITVGAFTFQTGEAWKGVEPVSRMARRGLEHRKKKLKADFFYFPGQGGGAQANIDRWLGQFQGKPASNTEKIMRGKQAIHLVEVTGTFMQGPPFGQKVPVANTRLLGAIVESDKGHVFIKLTGNKEAVAAIVDDFKALATSPFPEADK